MESQRGHRELEHTADWALEVWAPDLPTLLEEAARGMYDLLGLEVDPAARRQQRQLELAPPDREAALVELLGELLYLLETERIAFEPLTLDVRGGSLTAELVGAHVLDQTKEIKAVTYHQLEVRDTANGVEATVVFDV